ncbi:uncharacterized protein LOC117570453 [Drosophila albomicans]|uniref:Uncharacterized protein LOC117570453 n=1 Tax=Drosophila albomicans TaxID=7291 RepID=A0A6P8X485_DROAB|nr:uncharacterized protein LOC117570453 [Drosophila albomicans]
MKMHEFDVKIYHIKYIMYHASGHAVCETNSTLYIREPTSERQLAALWFSPMARPEKPFAFRATEASKQKETAGVIPQKIELSAFAIKTRHFLMCYLKTKQNIRQSAKMAHKFKYETLT